MAAISSAAIVWPAHDHEMRACRLLLPQAFADAAPEALVAARDGAILGAAAIAWADAARRPDERGCFPVLVHVVPEARRQGIGRTLVAYAWAACQADATGLRAWLPVAVDSEAAAFLRALGFSAHRRLLHFETDGARFHAMVEGLRVRLERAGRIAAEARIVPLHGIASGAVAALLHDDFAAPAATIVRRLSPSAPDGFDLDRSVALWIGEHLAGTLLYSWNGGLPLIDALAVAPPFRGTAALVLLLEAATRNGLAGGARRFRFCCDERTRDMVNLARRCGAEAIRVEAEYRLYPGGRR